MASSYTEMKKEVAECAICSEIYREPKILIVCGHTFCDHCIKNMPDYASNKVECPICRKVTEIPAGGLPPNFVVQDVAEPLRKQEDIRKEMNKSVTEFRDKVSSVCQNFNRKLEQWKSISEILNGMVAKSYEMIKTTETMDIDNCHQILIYIDKMTNIVTNISTDFNHLNVTRQLTVLQENTDNSFITNANIHLSSEIDFSTLSIEEGNMACASATSSKQETTNQVLLIGGYDYLPKSLRLGKTYFLETKKPYRKLELYNPNNRYNHQFLECKLHEDRWNHIAAILSDTLYVVGGGRANCTLNAMELFDPIRHQWLGYGPKINKARASFAGVVIHSQLMVFGGCSPASNHLCESFDPITQTWSPLPDMHIGRENHQGAQLNDEVYLIGGLVRGLFDRITSTVSIFDPNASTWTSGPSMRQARAHSAIAKLDNGIFVSGGHNQTDETLKNCEMLDPRQNKWMEIAPMKQERSEHVLVNCNGKLLAMGGRDSDRNSLSTVEEYDRRASQWKFVEPMNSNRSAFAAVIVP